jgi:protein-disulfide isomerase
MSQKHQNPSSILFAIAMLAMTTLACASRGTAPTLPQSPIEPGPVIATIDGESIHLSAVDQWLKDDWMGGIAADPTQLYQLRRAGLDGVIDDLLIERAAAQENLSSDAYLDQKTAALGPVSEDEVVAFYERNKDRLRPSESVDKLRYKIRVFLQGDRSARVINELRETAKIDILMTRPAQPPAKRQIVPAGGAARGPVDAPITIVEFSDYQCPFCRQAEDTVQQLEALYPGKLRIEYRHLPLDFHANAIPAAKAAICAGNQNQFWEYHVLLFGNQKALGPESLLSYATKLDLDSDKFKACIAAPETLARVNEDVALARSLGVKATPTFFVNGITLRGAPPTETFRALIDRELAQ